MITRYNYTNKRAFNDLMNALDDEGYKVSFTKEEAEELRQEIIDSLEIVEVE